MEKILVVEDDPQFAQILTFSLNQNGFTTDVVTSEVQALGHLRDNKYALILLDVFLPNKENGLNILNKLYLDVTIDPPPVVLMTSMPTQLFQQETNIDQYLDMSTELISKTGSPKEIVERVKQIIADHKQPS